MGNARVDFWAATLTAAATAAAFLIAVMTPPLSGPFCAADCIGYPYTDIATRIPRDFLWMYPALLPAPLLVLTLSGIHEHARGRSRGFSRLALAFGVMAAAVISADYFIQLRFVLPAIARGELDGLAPWSQYNPHGVFIALEEAGYLLMAIAFLFAGLSLSNKTRAHRPVQQVFISGFITVAVLFVVLSFVFGIGVDYRFEVAAISIDWAVLIAAGALLARHYGSHARAEIRPGVAA